MQLFLFKRYQKFIIQDQNNPKKIQIDAMIPPLVLQYRCGHIGVVLINHKTKLPNLNQKHSNNAQMDAPIPPLLRPYPRGCFCVVLIKNKTKLTKLNQKHPKRRKIDAPIPPLLRPYQRGHFGVFTLIVLTFIDGLAIK